MATETYAFQPDYAVPPGWILEERLERQGISQTELARRCGRSPKLISEIIAGKAPLEPETALQFEKVLGVDASIWMGIESDYRLRRAREAEAGQAAGAAAWAKSFPISELVKRGCLQKPESEADAVSGLLRFFGVASRVAWVAKYGVGNVAYRHSPSFESDEIALATWLRLGERDAESQACADYNEAGFRQAMRGIRGLTLEPIESSLPRATDLCNRAGVALALVPPLPKIAVSGAAWWLSPKKAVVQLSARHKTDDHLWFSFFHEAAHVLLHSKKGVFVDDARFDNDGIEDEANEWACNALVSRSEWRKFVATKPRSAAAVREFAYRQRLAPGIVVGMLQHDGVVPWTHLNGLKVRLKRTPAGGRASR